MNRSYGDQCGVARSLDVIGERWALLIVRELLLGPKRFNDLLAGLPGASPNVISQRLRELAGNDVVRHRDLGPPARVGVYELTGWGRELEPVVLHLGQWGTRAPLPEAAGWSLDSLLIALQGTTDPAVVNGRYELRVGTDVVTVDGTSGSVRMRRGTADRPQAVLTTDADTLHAVALGMRPIAEAARSGELRLDGDRPAIGALTSLLQSLTGSP
ncbi:MAG: winged helix-turn-helix transcriptional regulator [Nocardiopsaceae bacterium]|jgi:DNA-binding HxlR family transcriptional regulator|nr:winged helix-turn-helix transcriptional regulator [Nocardiopsaceae bacterium]